MLFRLNQVHHQLFAQTAVLRQEMHQSRLLQHHLSRHAHQLAIFSQRLRLAGQADHPDDLPLQAQRQVNPLAHPVEMASHRIVDIHHPPLGKHQQRAFVQFTNPFPIAAADNPPAGIHHVDVGIDDAHRPRHNILRHFGIKMPASHVILPFAGHQHKRVVALLHCAYARSPGEICGVVEAVTERKKAPALGEGRGWRASADCYCNSR